MASSTEFIDFVCSQIAEVGIVRAKKMFGDYCLYYNGKVIGLICDDYLYLKPLPQLQPLLHECDQRMQPPYDGAKPHYVISDVDDRDYVSLLVKTVAESIKNKKK